jgi:FADH2 O2-dependent halogenase
MGDFELFKRLTLLYFAAASFSETARRLGNESAARGFLLCDDPVFGPGARACAADAITAPRGRARQMLLARIDRTIEAFDVAGLGDRRRRDWYPAAAEDLIAAAPKLGASHAQIQQLLERCGFAPPEASP